MLKRLLAVLATALALVLVGVAPSQASTTTSTGWKTCAVPNKHDYQVNLKFSYTNRSLLPVSSSQRLTSTLPVSPSAVKHLVFIYGYGASADVTFTPPVTYISNVPLYTDGWQARGWPITAFLFDAKGKLICDADMGTY